MTLADQHGPDLPILASVAPVIDRRLKIEEAVENLLSRPFRNENPLAPAITPGTPLGSCLKARG
ncbi:MAG: hypothetical protein GDA41_10525 [Rhodospirillales bacterium]|nr:hypothetical protein [Rhodospirillales bacterium]